MMCKPTTASLYSLYLINITSKRGGVYSTEWNGTESWTKLWNGTLSQNEACSLPLLKLPLQVIDGPPAGD